MQTTIRGLISKFADDESGAALLEYSILIGLINRRRDRLSDRRR